MILVFNQSEGMPIRSERVNHANTFQDFEQDYNYKSGSRCDLQAQSCSCSFFADSEDGILIRGEVCDDSKIIIISY